MPLKNEINPLPLMRKLAGEGARLALPVVAGRGKPLIMRAWASASRLPPESGASASRRRRRRKSIRIFCWCRFLPSTAPAIASAMAPAITICTITRLRARKAVIAVGLAFAAQEVPTVPTTPRDARLDLVLTEREVIDLRGALSMRILFVGDVVGRSGRTVVVERLPGLIRDWKLDFVVVNGENAAGGFGITEAIYRELIDAGADADHARQSCLGSERGAGLHRARAERLIRPINYPRRHARPRRGVDARPRAARACSSSTPWAASSWIRSTIRSPRSIASLRPARCGKAPTPSSIDIHGEATSEKQAMGYFCDGRASLVVGTHTHAPTADLRILPGGTALHERRRHDRRLRIR